MRQVERMNARAVFDSLEPRLLMSACKCDLVSGTVYNDVNGNGSRDVGESGLKNWRVFADLNQNGIRDPKEPSALSASSGDYTILLSGTPQFFNVIEVVEAGWQATNPPGGAWYNFTGVSGFPGDHINYTNVNFGNHLIPPPAAASSTGTALFSTAPVEDVLTNGAADPHTVTVPLHAHASGNLAENFIEGRATHLGLTTAALNDQGVLVFTVANGDQIFSTAVFTPTSDPNVLLAEGTYLGGTGRFTGVSGTFSVELIFVDDQGDFVYRFSDQSLTLLRPWNDNALA